jgi:hypothetical protein
MKVSTVYFCVVHGYAHSSTERGNGDHLWCREESVTVVPGTVVASVSQRNEEPVAQPTHTLRSGDFAFIDSLRSGLVPVKVLSVNEREVTVRVTASRPGYTRYEKITLALPNPWIIARDQVHTRRGQFIVTGTVQFEVDQ